VVGDPSVVFQSLAASGLVSDRCHGDVADLEQFWRGEKGQICRVLVQRVDNAALLQCLDREAGLLDFDGACKPGGPGTDHDDVYGCVCQPTV